MVTKPTIALTDLVEKGADTTDPVLARRVIDFDVESLVGAGFDVKSLTVQTVATVAASLWQTRAGDVDLKIPKLRQ